MFIKKKPIETVGTSTSKALFFSLGAATLSSQAFAVGISDAKFIELGGSLSNDQATVRKVYDHLNQISREQRFDAVGRIIAGGALCTATWLGNEGDKAVILTAAHCVQGDNKDQESVYTGQNVSFRTGDGRLIASGTATTHFIGYTGCHSDIAIVKAPLLTSPINAQGGAVPQPVIADAPDFNQYVGKPMTLTGYGIQGTPSLGKVSSGRAYGLGHISRDVGGCLRNPANTEEAWAFGAPGDSGSATWQWREGQFVGVGVTSWWAGWNGRQSGHGRVAPYQAWMKKTYPEINTVTRTRTLTEDENVTLNDVEARVNGTVYYLAGNNVSGPTSGKWVYPRGFSALSVAMVNQTTGQTHHIKLRAQRQTWCGWGEINNGVYCSPDATKGGLKVWFDANDNTAAPAGLYQGDFSLTAKGWHDHSYSADIALKANILVGSDSALEGTVTASSAATTIRYDSTVNGSVYYLPEGNVQSNASGRVWSGQFNTWSSLQVPVVNKTTKESATIVLRASRYVGCGWSVMNNGVYCSNGANYGQLRVSYHPEDNSALPAGDYETLFNIRARGWHSDFNKLLTFKLDVEKGAQ
ncbi:trypsin-like peptidase domain-containing protein [Grimontia sp. SpTr1]|uniref:trypsin-like peptidase domain-containing protein n=1 Tax=Grimontia sp. SpTr1 TaxID=2995319 RepID=UPI00248AA632|nr:trypsin-like peptidase domain-containing protein [Grimontia sp. SpTr1]